MEDILFGRQRMNNEANIKTLRSPQKATDILVQFESQTETMKPSQRGLTQQVPDSQIGEECGILSFSQLILDWGMGMDNQQSSAQW